MTISDAAKRHKLCDRLGSLRSTIEAIKARAQVHGQLSKPTGRNAAAVRGVVVMTTLNVEAAVAPTDSSEGTEQFAAEGTPLHVIEAWAVVPAPPIESV